jgi:hypothetical protein
MTDELAQQLLALGARLEVPPAPDLTQAVVARLPERRPRRPRRARRTVAVALAAALVLAGTAMAVPATRHAILRVLGLRGVQIERVPRLPPAPAGVGRRLGLGQRIPLARARHAARFTALLPAQPMAAYLNHDVPGGRISLLRDGVLIIEFRGTAIPFIVKLLGPGTRVKRLRVNRDPAVYVYGAPHEIIFQEPTGEVQSDRIRLAGNVLIWQQGPLTLRIEGTHTLQQAVALAQSMH